VDVARILRERALSAVCFGRDAVGESLEQQWYMKHFRRRLRWVVTVTRRQKARSFVDSV
jgi:hypothetical protein